MMTKDIPCSPEHCMELTLVKYIWTKEYNVCKPQSGINVSFV